MKRSLLLLLSILLSYTAQSQVTDTTQAIPFVAADKQPDFPGGQEAFLRFLGDKLVYPTDSYQKRIQGMVIIAFIIEKDGRLTNLNVLRHVADDLDAEAIRVLKTSPKWSPGFQNRIPIRVNYTIPITFKLPEYLVADTTTTNNSDLKYSAVEVQPEYPGGIEALDKYIRKNLHTGGEVGTVKISFIVERDGGVTDIRAIQGISEKADLEAIRVIAEMPKWKPGMQGGRPVRVNYTIPVYFTKK